MAWPKHLTVDKRIVLLLSASTYESFPRALRELVSNGYDADATEVSIEISLNARSVVITDNGSGMTPDEFDFFLRIAGRQRSKSRTTLLGRERIGQFGIGFLAMFPFCTTVEVESTVAGSVVKFVARIPASRFFKRTDTVEDLTEAEVVGEEFRDTTIKTKHYTRLRLIGTTKLLDRYLGQRQQRAKYINSIRALSGMERLKWELQDILPISLPRRSKQQPHVDPDPPKFAVILNDERLVANDFVEQVLAHSNGIEQVGGIGFRWAIGTPWRAVKPDEGRGLRIRLHRVGVGPRQFFDLGVAGRTFSRLHWLTGEVNILSGLDESITLDRDGFTQSQDFEDFREFFRSKLRELAYYIEDVDVARRRISAQMAQSPRATSAPTGEVVAEQIKKLERRGFRVQQTAHGTSGRRNVRIDTEKRVVTIPRRQDHGTEQISVAGKIWNLKYDNWEFHSGAQSACRIIGPRTVVLNQKYPLFHGAHKDVFRRLFIIVAYAERESKSKKHLVSTLQELLLREFAKTRGK